MWKQVLGAVLLGALLAILLAWSLVESGWLYDWVWGLGA